jgi:hypothetical protein
LTETNFEEYAASEWNCEGGSQDGSQITLDLGEQAECTITNTLLRGNITVIKDARPNDGLDFNFTITSGGNTIEEFQLDDCPDNTLCPIAELPGDEDLNNTETFTLPTGTYTISEVFSGGLLNLWNTTNISCTALGNSVIGPQMIPDSKLGGNITVTLESDDDVVCTFVNESLAPSRTQGFWKTHTNVTIDLFNNPPEQDSAAAVGFTNRTMIIGNETSGKTIDNAQEIFGLYMSSNSWQSDKYEGKKSDGTPRTPEEQTNIIMLHQLITAKLNCGQFSCPAVIEDLINTCDEAFASGNLTAMMTAPNPLNSTRIGCTTALDDYNNSGETEYPFPPGATPSLSRELAESPIKYHDDELMLHQGETGISRWDMPFAMSANINVTKIVIKDDGGNETADDFGPYTVNGNEVYRNTTTPVSGGNNGVHQVAEQTDPNYVQTFEGDCDSSGMVTIFPEQNATCTITNDDIPPFLNLTKLVNNDDGGTATPSQFYLSAN